MKDRRNKSSPDDCLIVARRLSVRKGLGVRSRRRRPYKSSADHTFTAREWSQLTIGWVVVVKLICDEWREGMLNIRGRNAVMREVVGCEVHAQQHVRGLGHSLGRAKSLFTQNKETAATNIPPRYPLTQARCGAISRWHSHHWGETIASGEHNLVP